MNNGVARMRAAMQSAARASRSPRTGNSMTLFLSDISLLDRPLSPAPSRRCSAPREPDRNRPPKRKSTLSRRYWPAMPGEMQDRAHSGVTFNVVYTAGSVRRLLPLPPNLLLGSGICIPVLGHAVGGGAGRPLAAGGRADR